LILQRQFQRRLASAFPFRLVWEWYHRSRYRIQRENLSMYR